MILKNARLFAFALPWLLALMLPNTTLGQCHSHEHFRLQAPSGPRDDRFAHVLAARHDILVVGVYLDDARGTSAGSVWVYRRQGDDYVAEQKLFATDADPFDYFGWSVSTDGEDLIAVGASGDDSYGRDIGAGYVFRFNGSQWLQEAKIVPTGLRRGVGSQSVIGIDGDYLIMGYTLMDNERGAVYPFTFDGAQWVAEPTIQPSDSAPNDNFGFAVAIDGDRILSGSAMDTGDGPGKATVFRRELGQWVEEQVLIGSDAAQGDEAGWSVALSGDYALVGAPSKDGRRGAAYLYYHDGTTIWSESQKLTASDGTPGDRFGSYLAIADDMAVVTAFGDGAHGSAYAYQQFQGTFESERKLTPSDGRGLDLFGAAVATNGDWIFVGMMHANAPGEAYVFSGSRLLMIVHPDEVSFGEAIHFDVCFGEAHAPGLIAAVDVQGLPVFLPILVGTFDASGQMSLSGPLPPGVPSIEVGFRAFGLSRHGVPLVSHLDRVRF